jgi:hypothetical protein
MMVGDFSATATSGYYESSVPYKYGCPQDPAARFEARDAVYDLAKQP